MDLQQTCPDSATPTGPPPTMAAVVHARYGPPAVLALGRTGRPTPKPTEALLAVRAAGMSRGVWHMTTGRPYIVRLAIGLRRPRQANPGMDVCEEVLEALATDGTLVFVGNESGDRWTGGYGRPFAYHLRMACRRQRFVNLLARTDAADLTRLADHARIDGLRPHIHATFSLGGARAALEELISGSTAGKMAIEIAHLGQRVAA